MALLEVLVAIALLGGAGLGIVAALRQAVAAERAAAEAEQRLAAADRVLAALTLLHTAELDQRIGARTIGEFEVRIARPRPGLYRLALLPRDGSGQELLATLVARVPR